MIALLKLYMLKARWLQIRHALLFLKFEGIKSFNAGKTCLQPICLMITDF